jgi:hypothetical protein
LSGNLRYGSSRSGRSAVSTTAIAMQAACAPALAKLPGGNQDDLGRCGPDAIAPKAHFQSDQIDLDQSSRPSAAYYFSNFNPYFMGGSHAAMDFLHCLGFADHHTGCREGAGTGRSESFPSGLPG